MVPLIVREITSHTKTATPIAVQLTVFGVHGVHGEVALGLAEVVPKRGGGQKPRLLNMVVPSVREIT